jgi:hypothetical protein
MLMKIGGFARALAIILAVVGGFVALNMMDLPLVLIVLGLIAGLAMTDDRVLLATATVIALPIIGTALTHIPAIGAQLNTVALNLTSIAIKLYHFTMDGVMGLAGGAGGTAAAAAR